MRLIPEREYEGIPQSVMQQLGQPIGAEQMLPASIITGVLKDGSVATAKIEDLAVTTGKINSLAVTAAKIDDLAVTNAKIYDCAIGKLTAGDLNVIGTIVSGGKFVTGVSPNPRIEITDTEIVGYSDATTKQFYLDASDGKGYFGAGACYLDAGGITLVGTNMLRFGTSDESYIFKGLTDSLWLTSAEHIILIAGAAHNIMIDNPLVPADGADTNSVGTTTYYFSDVASKILTLSETTTPSAVANFGKVYTKADNIFYFQDGAGDEHAMGTAAALTTHEADTSTHGASDIADVSDIAATKLDDFTAPDDTTDLDATDALHGLMSKADKGKLNGVATGADVTGSNAPQAHKASHENTGGDEISVVGLSGLLADDQHVLDAEAVAAVEAAGLSLDSTKNILIPSDGYIRLGALTGSPKLFGGESESPYELFLQPSAGNNIGELGIMPSGTQNQAGVTLWNASDYDNGGFAWIWVVSNALHIAGGKHGTGTAPTGFYIALNTYPSAGDTYVLGDYVNHWSDVVTKILTLTETTTPTAIATVGKVYTKDDNKIYFQDGAGDEHELAFAV